MSDDDSAALQGAATTTAKRAQWEAFDFELLEVGAVRVTNNSHADPDEHTYTIDVDVDTGRAVSCSCPADEYHDGPCKHRVAVENTPAVLAAASGVVDAADDPARDVATDGGTVVDGAASDEPADEPTYTYHREPAHVGGARYVRCESCGSESVPADPDRLLHHNDCPHARRADDA
jgi:hypothetical protein